MNETVLSVVGLVLVAVSLCFSALQTREVARQSRINNGIGSATALVEVNNLIRAWHERLLEDPPVRSYFFDGKPATPDDVQRPKVLTLAELLADVLECNLQMASLLPAFDFAHSWHHWPAQMLQQSPALAEVVESHPDWWPTLRLLQKQVRESTGAPSTHPLVPPRVSRWTAVSLRRAQRRLPQAPRSRVSARTVAPAGNAPSAPQQ
ncbi:hypothetical protein [Micromonospora sp. NPDC049301]|uniref:hypothetical protein n=1 Tax=Micromonospora sp. NPDC049301 TaxID=3155723 RepID=UPI0034325E2A